MNTSRKDAKQECTCEHTKAGKSKPYLTFHWEMHWNVRCGYCLACLAHDLDTTKMKLVILQKCEDSFVYSTVLALFV